MALALLAAVYGSWRFGDEVASWMRPSPHATVASGAPVPLTAPGAPVLEVPTPAQQRPIYPHSIVSGGVQSVEELRLAMQFDPIVAAHFADFDLDRARVERVAISRAVYVSYRSGDRVGWTSKKISLRAGETILTDGVNEARTRCGNRLAEVKPAEIVLEDEPAPETLETPLPARTLPIDPLAAYDLFAADGALPPALDAADALLPSSPLPGTSLTSAVTGLPGMDVPQIPLLPLIPYGVVLGSDPSDLDPVPEPATLLLVSPGLAAYAWWRRRSRRRTGSSPPAN